MADSTVTSKGQTTVPAAVREALRLAPGTRLVWHVLSDGSVLVRAKNRSIRELAGSLKPASRKRVRIEDMNPWR